MKICLKSFWDLAVCIKTKCFVLFFCLEGEINLSFEFFLKKNLKYFGEN
jgi:hypothetical protein